LDGSEEVVEGFPDTKSTKSKWKGFSGEGSNEGWQRKSHTKEIEGGFNDSGSASRFFYCAKASKSERNKGTNNFIIINICVENTEQGELLKKDISERTELWFTELFGKKKMEEYQMDFKFTTKMETKKTTISLILSCLQHLNIKEFIQDALKEKTENGGNLIENVENIKEWKPIIIKELMEYLLGVNPVVLPVPLKISVSENNFHSTVKPVKLMRYLCRLITPKGGTILDPFMGSGSTGIGAKLEGFNFIGIELDEEYLKIAEARIKEQTQQQTLI